MKKIKKKALVTGITGQDGSYLAEFYEKGYEVHGAKNDQAASIQRGSIIIRSHEKGELFSIVEILPA